MSEQELQELVERNLSPENQSISTETALEAARKIIEIADKENVSWALAGGIAMHLYGFTRATKDVDFVASHILSTPASRYLTFGGARYEIETENRKVAVDWIVRRDNYRKYYEIALTEATEFPNGLKIISPEWLVLLKYAAGRHKDELDIVWLLQQENLVNRQKLRNNLSKVTDEAVARIIYREIRRRYFPLASSPQAEGDENESYNSEELID